MLRHSLRFCQRCSTRVVDDEAHCLLSCQHADLVEAREILMATVPFDLSAIATYKEFWDRFHARAHQLGTCRSVITFVATCVRLVWQFHKGVLPVLASSPPVWVAGPVADYLDYLTQLLKVMRRNWSSCHLWLLNPCVPCRCWSVSATYAPVLLAWCFLLLAPIRSLAVGSSHGLHPWCDGSFRPRLPFAETITLNSCYVLLCVCVCFYKCRSYGTRAVPQPTTKGACRHCKPYMYQGYSRHMSSMQA